MRFNGICIVTQRLQAMNVEIVNRLQPNRGGVGPFGFAIQIGTSSISMSMWRFKNNSVQGVNHAKETT